MCTHITGVYINMTVTRAHTLYTSSSLQKHDSDTCTHYSSLHKHDSDTRTHITEVYINTSDTSAHIANYINTTVTYALVL